MTYPIPAQPPDLWILLLGGLAILACPLPIPASRSRALRNSNASPLPAGIAFPDLTDYLHLNGVLPGEGSDFAVPALAFMGLCFTWVLLRGRGVRLTTPAAGAVLDCLEDPLVVLDHHAKVVDVNRAATANWGLGRDSTGRDATELPAPFPELLARAGTGETFRAEAEIRHEGRTRAFSVAVSPVFDRRGRRLGTSLLGHDITEGKADQKALEASEERFRTLVESASDAFFLPDA